MMMATVSPTIKTQAVRGDLRVSNLAVFVFVCPTYPSYCVLQDHTRKRHVHGFIADLILAIVFVFLRIVQNERTMSTMSIRQSFK